MSQIRRLKVTQTEAADTETRRQCTANIVSDDYGDFVLDYYFPQPVEATPATYCSQVISNRFVSFYVPRQEWEPLSYSRIPYDVVPKLYSLQDTTSMTAAGITQVQQSLLGVTGSGVLIGIVDTGVDYESSAFRNADGSTRIRAIWDQTIQDGPLPRWASYGSEYRQEQINEALRAADPFLVVPSRDTDGHGTFVAGIAAGSRSEDGQFVGAAPGADIAVVKLKPAKQYLRDFYGIQPDAAAYQENDIMLAAAYLRELREELDLPLVILCALGTNWGSHSGTAQLEQMLSALADQPGVSVVVAVGNETGAGHHFRGQIQKEGAYQDVEIRVGPEERGFQLELWSQVPDRFTVSILSPGGNVVPQIPASLGQNQTVEFVLENTTVDVSYRFFEVQSNNHLAVMRFVTPSPGVWTVRVYCIRYLTGVFHMWLPNRTFVGEETAFLSPDPNITLMIPSTAENLLGIAAYDHTNGNLYIRSGRGYTRSGAIKPDLAAPGVDVYGPALGDRYTRRTGTSVAAAHVAGAAACLLEWGVVRGNRLWINNNAIRAVLIQGARRTFGITYPNEEWGYGTLDLYGTFNGL